MKQLPLTSVSNIVGRSVDLYRAVCEQDVEGIVAKLGSAPYTPEATTWVKVKNPAYTQAEGRADFFEDRPEGRLGATV